MPDFNVNMIKAVKVLIKKPIFEDDFPEKGMTAWLTGIELEEADAEFTTYRLFFDFTDFEEQNEKYMREVFFANAHTGSIRGGKSLYTAREAGMYSPKYAVFYSEPEGPTRMGDLPKLSEYLIYIGEEGKV